VSVQVGELFATLKLEKGRFEQDVKGGGSLWGGLAKVALGAATVISGAILGIGIASAHSAEEQERVDDRIRRLLGKNANAFIEWAGKNAVALRVTDDHLEDLGATAIQAFQTMGIGASKSIGMTQELMKRAADISATTGKSFDEVFSALVKGTQGATKGLKGIGVVVDQNAIKQEALRLGLWKGTGALSASAKAAAVYSLEMKGTASAAGAAADKQGTMAETMKIIPVLMDRVMDAVGRVFLPIVRAVLPAVVGAFEGLANVVEGSVGSIGDSVTGVGSTIGSVFGGIASLIRPLVDGVLPRVQSILSLIGTQVVPVLASAFGTFTSTILPALQRGFSAIADNIIPALAGAFEAFVTGVLPILTEAFQLVATEIMPAVASAMDFLSTTVIPAIGDAINWLATEILPPIMAAFQAIAENVIPILVAALDTVVAVVRDNWPTISSIAQQVGNAIKIAVDVVSAVIQAVAPVIRWLAETIFPILGAAAGFLLKAIDTAFKAIGVIWDAILQAGKATVDGLSAAFNGLVGVFHFIGDAIGAVFRTAMNFLIGIVNAVIGAVNSIQVHIGRIGLDTPAGFVGVGPFDWNGLQLPNLRYLQSGTPFFAGGLAMLGEKGPELAELPAGTRVHNAQDTAAILGRSGGQRVYQLTVQGNLEAKDEASVLATLRRLEAFGEA
jgi:hypothetical protein